MTLPLVVGFLCSNVLKSLKQARKAIASSFVVLLIKVLFAQLIKMSWRKESAAVCLSGLTPSKATRGALTCPEFQKIPEPLDRDPFGPVVVKAEVRNTLCNFEFKNVEHVDRLGKIYFIAFRGWIRSRRKGKPGMRLGIVWG